MEFTHGNGVARHQLHVCAHKAIRASSGKSPRRNLLGFGGSELPSIHAQLTGMRMCVGREGVLGTLAGHRGEGGQPGLLRVFSPGFDTRGV